MHDIRVIVTTSDSPAVADIGWAAARRDGLLAIVVSSRLATWEQNVAVLEAATDEEFVSYELGLPVEDQERRMLRRRGFDHDVSSRVAAIRFRTYLGATGRWDAWFAGLPGHEQARHDVSSGQWETRFAVPA